MSALKSIQKKLQNSKRSFSNLTGSLINRTRDIGNDAMRSPASPSSLLHRAAPSMNRANQKLNPIVDKLSDATLEFGVRDSARLYARTLLTATGQKEYALGQKKGAAAGFEEALFGKKGKADNIYDFKEGNKRLNKDLEKYISPGKARIAAPLLIGAGTMLDAVPLNGDDFLKKGGKKVGKEAVETIATKNADDVLEKFIGKKFGEKAAKSKALDRLKSTAHSLYTQIVDEIHPAVMLEKKAQEASGVVGPAEKSIVYKFKKYLGSGGTAAMRHEKELKPILSQLGDLPKEEFDAFLVAKRDLGFNEAGREIVGSDADEARAVLTALNEKYGADIYKEMEEIATKLYAYQDKSLRKLVDAGFIDEAEYEAIKSGNIDYVPYKRVLDKVDEALGLGGSLQVGSKPDMLKGIKGSDKAIQSPLESIIADTYKIEHLVAKNDFAKSVVDLKDFLPEGTIKVLRSYEKVKKRATILSKLHDNKLSRNETKRLLRTQKNRLRVLRKELGQIHSMALRQDLKLDKMKALPEETLTNLKFKDDMLVSGKIDRQTRFSYGALTKIIKAKDSKKFLYKLMELPAEDLKYLLNKAGAKTTQVDNILKEIDGLKKAMSDTEINRQVLRKGLNELRDTPAFDKSTVTVWRDGVKEVYEVPRDIENMMKGLDKESANMFTKLASNASGVFRQGQTGRNIDFMIPNVFKDQFDAALGSKYGYIPFIDYFRGLAHLVRYDLTGSDRLVEEWIKAGGDIAFSKAAGRNLGKEVMSAAEKKRISRRMLDWATGKLDLVGRYSEIPTRLGVAKKAYEKTGSMAEAVIDSREATVDFARMGSKMKVLNSVIPFLNPQVQGFDKLLRVAKNDPKKFAMTMGAYGAFPAAMVSIYNNTHHGKDYAKVPEWEKESNFIIMTGGVKNGKPTYIKIPKGNIVPLIANPVDHFVSHLYKNDSQSFGQLAASMLTGALPVIGEGSNKEEIASRTMGNITPQIIKPGIEAMTNYDFFKAGPIESRSMQFKDEEDRAREDTPDVYGVIGKAVGLSPLKVEKVMEGYLASFSKTPADITEIVDDVANGKPVNVNSIPILRRFFGDYVDFEDQAKTKNVKGLKVKKLKPGLRLTPSNRL